MRLKILDPTEQLTKVQAEDIKNSSSLYSTKDCCDNHKAFQKVKDTIAKLSQQINEFSTTISTCYRQVESNQIMINYMMSWMNIFKSSGRYLLSESIESKDILIHF
jgi:hypothetical protein